MMTEMQIPMMIGKASHTIGPAYADTNYDVVFDGIDNNYLCQLCMDDGLVKWTSLSKTAGTSSGIKLTYRVNTTYTDITTGNTVAVAKSTESNPTPFYLALIK